MPTPRSIVCRQDGDDDEGEDRVAEGVADSAGLLTIDIY
jgi:hypothetical protein